MLGFRCLYCSALPGRWCVKFNMQPTLTLHVTRFQQATRAGELPIKEGNVGTT